MLLIQVIGSMVMGMMAKMRRLRIRFVSAKVSRYSVHPLYRQQKKQCAHDEALHSQSIAFAQSIGELTKKFIERVHVKLLKPVVLHPLYAVTTGGEIPRPVWV